MDQHITRPILWNVPVPFIVIMYGLLALLIAAFIYAGLKWYRIIRLGVRDNRFDHLGRRLLLAFRDGIGQGYVVRETWGWMHYAFYVAFIGLTIGTTIVLINSDIRDLARLFGIPV